MKGTFYSHDFMRSNNMEVHSIKKRNIRAIVNHLNVFYYEVFAKYSLRMLMNIFSEKMRSNNSKVQGNAFKENIRTSTLFRRILL